jgi:3',5'-cyclic AMP phosphodiesterase CpdA
VIVWSILAAILRDSLPLSERAGCRLAFVSDTTLASVKELAAAVRLQAPDAIVFCGDMANELSSAPARRHFRRWRNGWGDLRDRVYPVPGNHDYGRSGLRHWWEQAAAQVGGDAQWFENRAFLLATPLVRVFGLDCGPTAKHLDQAQLDWLADRAGSTAPSAPWSIIALHVPLVPVSIHMNSPMSARSSERLSRFASLVGAQLLVCGHEHVYARLDSPDGSALSQVTVGGGGADPYPIVHAGLRSSASRRHFLLLGIGPDRLEGMAYDFGGECFDSWTWDSPVR